MANYTHLKSGQGSFDQMMANGFGIVTVMNAKVYNYDDVKASFTPETGTDTKTKVAFLGEISGTPICTLDTLKVANVTEEGPTKTITGGQFSNPLIKFGKTARLEMQDALGNANAIEALCGGLNQWSDSLDGEAWEALHFGQDFCSAKTIVGDSFFIDRISGQQVKVKIVFYQMLPDSIFNLTQDAEGDATVFDMNGDLLATDVHVGTEEGTPVIAHSLFYSIFPAE